MAKKADNLINYFENLSKNENNKSSFDTGINLAASSDQAETKNNHEELIVGSEKVTKKQCNFQEKHQVKTEESGREKEETNSDSDELFGFNDFDENQEGIVEAYKDKKRELVIVTLNRRTVTLNDSRKDFKKNTSFLFSREECNEKQRYVNVNNLPFNDISNLTEDCDLNNEENSTEDEEYDDIITAEKQIYEDNYYQYWYATYEDTNVVEDKNSCISSNKNMEKKEKIIYIIEEMMKTEDSYIQGLDIVVNDYMPFLTTENLVERTILIFGNIETIHINAKKFHNLLKRSEKDADSIAQLFIDNVEMFELYPIYSRNKPTADKILQEFDNLVKHRQVIIKDNLGLLSYLITPIQRLGKYVLLLEQMQKELKKNQEVSEIVEKAIEAVRNIMKKGNDYLAIDSIIQSPLDFNLHGSFIMRALFSVIKPKKFISMVFLFENVIVFTVKNSKSLEEYKYVDSIQMSDLSLIRNITENSNIFHLINHTKLKKGVPDARYILKAKTLQIKFEWIYVIEKKLWIQLKKAKEAALNATVSL